MPRKNCLFFLDILKPVHVDIVCKNHRPQSCSNPTMRCGGNSTSDAVVCRIMFSLYLQEALEGDNTRWCRCI